MSLSFYDHVRPEKFREAYQEISHAFEELGDQPIGGLLDKINHAEKNILFITPRERTNEQWDYLEQIGKDIEAEAKRYNELEKQNRITKVNQELSDLEKKVMPKNIPKSEREEISSYFQLKKNHRPCYKDTKFINGISNVESKYLLPFLKITQTNLKDKMGRTDWEYYDKLMENLSNLFKSLPIKYKDRIIDVLATSAEKGNFAVGVYILLEQLPKQLGLVEYDESQFTEPNKIPEEHRDFYLETAKRLVDVNHRHDYEILRNFPDIIEKEGLEETKRILDIALRIRDENFPGECNVALLYTGIKAGHHFCGDQEKHKLLIKRVEEKYKS